jgi:hypothetical protein
LLTGHARTVARFSALQLVACVGGMHLDDGGSIEVCLLQQIAGCTHVPSVCARARKPSKHKHRELKEVQCMDHPVICTDCCPPAGVFRYGLAAHSCLVHRGKASSCAAPAAPVGITDAEIASVKDLVGRHERDARCDGGTSARAQY